ncbi:hypothetical protein ANN_06620, partial [Periplaneta americana]
MRIQSLVYLGNFFFGNDGMGNLALILFGEGVVFFLILIFIDYRMWRMALYTVLDVVESRDKGPPQQDVDTDVAETTEIARSISPMEVNEQHRVLLKDVTKKYGQHTAVNKLNLGMKHGECFGLLGANGAGKTTIFKMMTGELPVTKGDIYVNGQHMKKNLTKVMYNYELFGHVIFISNNTSEFQFVDIFTSAERSEGCGKLSENMKLQYGKYLEGSDSSSSLKPYVQINKGHHNLIINKLRNNQSTSSSLNIFTCTYERMGYCPQFDSIPQYMTPKEVLSMFSLIRGIPRKQIEDVTCDMAKELKLTEHFKKKINSCSGGTKRKVSACIALLGNPLVVFLDDPTTGIDPESRRKLWDMISWLRTAGSTVVLTSHSMEECEALCTNLAIMANGQLQYLGSAQYLKNKYGQVYILSIKIKESPLKHTSDMASIEAYVLDKFP